MTDQEFTAALDELGWDTQQAATELGVASRSRISEWSTGYRDVPGYIAASVRSRLELERCRAELASPDAVE